MIVSLSRCPSCGSHDNRWSRARPPILMHLIGFRFVRCRRCYYRFLRHILLHDAPEPGAAPRADPLNQPDRRQAQRFPLRVPATIEFPDSGRSHDPIPAPTVIQGSTRDISMKGVSVALPRIENGARFTADTSLPLRIRLHFPTTQIELSAQAVRIAEADDDGAGADHIVGAYITEVEGGFSNLFNGIIGHAPGGRAVDA